MKTKSILQTVATAVSISLSLSAFAVTCPDTQLIRQSSEKLDNIIPLGGSDYAVLTNHPAFKDPTSRNWYIALFVRGESDQEALKNAKEGLKKASGPVSKEAEEDKEQGYYCGYKVDSEYVVISAFSPKDEQQFSLRSLGRLDKR